MFSFESRTRFWLFVFLLLIAALWVLKPVLLPFLAGMVIAYFLNPVVDILTRRHVPRWLGSLVVLLLFVLVVVSLGVLILPMLNHQIGALLNSIPNYIQQIRMHYIPWFQTWLARFSPDDVERLRDAAGQSAGEAASFFANMMKNIISGSFAVIDVMALSIITPVVAFYLLRDWPKLTAAIDSSFPRRHYDVIREQLDTIDATLSGFIRGQALVCLSLGLLYSTGLSVVGLQYGVAIGVTSGVLSFIPYVGTIFGWVVSLILAFVQFENDWVHIGMVAGVFYVGHVLEAYVLTPKLVGHRVGLHPVWVLFALITGAKLMGFTGVLIAVPTAAVLGVLARFAIGRYKESALYKDPLAPHKP